ncbi:midnolin-B-like [Anneissia japonica]|uniref:midnolin-B-like n=1 Tax=Anneissia japonica TaxID=1529436 RepID=UPI00142576C0|nr:midnolin-B-like [Anneissia japonica]
MTLNFDTSIRGRSPAHSGRNVLIHVQKTTGGKFSLHVPLQTTVDELKASIARKLRITKERLSLLYKETHLTSGTMNENFITDGSCLTLLPVVESGLDVGPQYDQNLVQALQNLSDTQVNDFLNGKQPLTLALRWGNHMVFVQLQLAASPNGGKGQIKCPLHHSSASRRPHHFRRNSSDQAPAAVNTPPCPLHPRSIPSSPPPSPTTTSPATTHATCGAKGQQSWPRTGAYIDQVNHYAPGVFSGTFSGSLNTAMSDEGGKQKRDINTIACILNDLLKAAPVYKQLLEGRPRAPAVHTTNSTSDLPGFRRRTNDDVRQEKHTRDKMAHLQMMMKDRQERRRARRSLRSPYNTTHRSMDRLEGSNLAV